MELPALTPWIKPLHSAGRLVRLLPLLRMEKFPLNWQMTFPASILLPQGMRNSTPMDWPLLTDPVSWKVASMLVVRPFPMWAMLSMIPTLLRWNRWRMPGPLWLLAITWRKWLFRKPLMEVTRWPTLSMWTICRWSLMMGRLKRWHWKPASILRTASIPRLL